MAPLMEGLRGSLLVQVMGAACINGGGDAGQTAMCGKAPGVESYPTSLMTF